MPRSQGASPDIDAVANRPLSLGPDELHSFYERAFADAGEKPADLSGRVERLEALLEAVLSAEHEASPLLDEPPASDDALAQAVRERDAGGVVASDDAVERYRPRLLEEEEVTEAPVGIIVMWAGVTVPDGWALCDGTNGTPDLRNRFIVATGSEYALGATGGSKTYQIPQHQHVTKAGANIMAGTDADVGDIAEDPIPSIENVEPPYYALALIMKL